MRIPTREERYIASKQYTDKAWAEYAACPKWRVLKRRKLLKAANNASFNHFALCGMAKEAMLFL